MIRAATAVLLCLALAAGCSHHHDGHEHTKGDDKHEHNKGNVAEVVKYADGTLVVKSDGKDRTITFAKGRPHLHAADGRLIKEADYSTHLRPGVKVELEEEGGKVTEVLLKE